LSFFDNRSPWKNIRTEIIDGNKVVRIPKFYVKYKTRKFRPSWLISFKKRAGFKVHPAFMLNGKELSCFFVGAYASTKASSNISDNIKADSNPGNSIVNINWEDLVRSCDNIGEGWHALNIYERHAISLLMLVELGGPNVNVLLGNPETFGTTENNIDINAWRGIYMFYGHNYEATPGIQLKSGKLHVWDINGYHTFVETVEVSTSYHNSYFNGFEDAHNTDDNEENDKTLNNLYDLRFLFIPNNVELDEERSATGDVISTNNLEEAVCWMGGDGQNIDNYASTGSGLFCLAFTTSSNESMPTGGVRIAKYGDEDEE